MGTEWLDCCNDATAAAPAAKITSGASETNSATYLRSRFGIAQTPSILDTEVSAVGPASFLQALDEGVAAGLPFRIVRSQAAHEHADAPHPLALLRARRERPCGRRPAEQRDECAALHSITSSAATSS